MWITLCKAPCEIVQTPFGGVVGADGGDGHYSIHRGHIDDGASMSRALIVLLHHLACRNLATLRGRYIKWLCRDNKTEFDPT